MYLKCRCKETKIKPFDFWKERKAETRKIWLKLWNIINQVDKKLKKYNIANSPQKPLSDITARFALPNRLQICYQLQLLELMKWGEENVTLLLFMEEETQNISQCPLKEIPRSFQSCISLVWVSHWNCKKLLFQEHTWMHLNHNNPFNSRNNHASARGVFATKWWWGVSSVLPSRQHSCCQFKVFYAV